MSYQDPVWSPSALLRWPALLSLGECNSIRGHMLSSPTYTRSIMKRDGTPAVDTRIRRTTNVKAPEAVRVLVDQRLAMIQNHINRHFSLNTSQRQQAQYLIYRSGDFFGRHRDDAPESDLKYLVSRKISTVIFLNDLRTIGQTFQGGVLSLFWRFRDASGERTRLDVVPEEGLLIAFPSYLLHQVSQIKSGLRFTVVSWFT
jgi:predicted 2-oxoglutarate/Fe(II)-dependent dioxygenase YbiX